MYPGGVQVRRKGKLISITRTMTTVDSDCIQQILGVTCDNTSNNDVMVNHLAVLVPTFAGASDRTHCFLHVINLVAKSLLHLFNIKKNGVDAVLNEAYCDATDLDAEMDSDKDNPSHHDATDLYADSETDEDDTKLDECDEGDDGEAVNDEGWVDEVDHMTAAERREMRESIQPLKLVLVKVGNLVVCRPAAQPCSPDLQTCLQNHSFQHYDPAGLEADPSRCGRECHLDAMRCSDTMEFHLRHVGLRDCA